jgi:16S rRNA (cytosine967-C5)-methyltransferase
MSISPARITAFDILLQVEKDDAYASELLHASQYLSLSSEDHGLATQIVMGVLRWRSQLDSAIAPLSKWPLTKLDAEVLTALRMGAYQLNHLERVPAHAAVHESVELVKRSRRTSAAGLVNALLRKLGSSSAMLKRNAISSDAAPETSDAIAKRFAHPEWLVQRWVAQFGLQTARAVCSENQRVPATHIHVRDLPGGNASPPFDFVGENIQLAPGSLLASARRVESGDVTKTKAFRNGHVAIQDEGSQLVAFLVGRGSRILDCCAAPGGKTAILAEVNPGSEIVAVDVHSHRTRLLSERVRAPNVRIVTADVRALPGSELFERILLDAPCSGTGTLARHPEIKWRLRPENILELQSLQISLLQSSLRHLSPAGTLLYSTCSIEAEECEQVVERVLAADSKDFELVDIAGELRRLQDEKTLTTSNLASLTQGQFLRTLPGIHPCDGFFSALFRRK